MHLKSHAPKVALWIFVVTLTTTAHAVPSWSESKSCWNMGFEGVTTKRYESLKEQSIRGVVSYSGDVPIRGVKVCGGGSCTVAAYGEMHKGDSAEFSLSVPHLNGVTLTVDCSALESR
jgi:hypothetical protein